MNLCKMMFSEDKLVEYLVVDTTAFIQNAPLQEVGANIITVPEVVNEITSKRQLRRLVVLPYDLVIKEAFPENVQIITEFAKKTGDYPSLSATDIKVMALTYQLEKEQVGTTHLLTQPKMQKSVSYCTKSEATPETKADIVGFYLPGHKTVTDDLKEGSCAGEELTEADVKLEQELTEKFEKLECNLNLLKPDNGENVDDILAKVSDKDEEFSTTDDEADDDDSGWITPSNVSNAKKQINSQYTETINVKVACMTTDFAMQNVLKQMNLNVSALDGRLIKQLRTFILRCYTCFGLTSIMTKTFCPKCGNSTLKKVSVSLDENGKQQVHINGKRPLTSRGKKFSMPTFKGGKHSNNPVVTADQPMPDQRSTRLASMKNNPMDDDYIAGYSPFVMRDVNSKSAQLCIRPGQEVKHWMRKNPNEARGKRK